MDLVEALYHLNRARWYNPSNGRFVSVDPRAGDPQSPVSLHRYLYCGNQPLNRIDPSGLLWIDLFYGKKVHDFIGYDFISRRTGVGIYDRSLNTILETNLLLGGLLRPDLVDMEDYEVYEIKPILSADMGYAQLWIYLGLMNLFDPEKRKWHAGTTYLPPKTVPLDRLAVAIVFPPKGGVILYQVFDLKPIIAAAMAFHIAYTLERMSLPSARFGF